MKNHAISHEKASAMVERFKGHETSLPDGFTFDAHQVVELLKKHGAKYFVIKFGVNDAGEITPILCAADADYKVIAGQDSAGMMATADGGSTYLDEGSRFPPPVIEI